MRRLESVGYLASPTGSPDIPLAWSACGEIDEKRQSSSDRYFEVEDDVKQLATPDSDSPVENWPRPQKAGQLAFQQSTGGFQVRVVSPSFGWATHRSWELLVSRSYLGWKVQLQPFLHSPDQTLLSKLVEKDAVADLSYLVESGQANLRQDVNLFYDVYHVSHPAISVLEYRRRLLTLRLMAAGL